MKRLFFTLLLASFTVCSVYAEGGKLLSSADLDRLVQEEFHKSKAPMAVADELFLRRLSLDLIGRPPTPAELDTFMKDKAANKRAKAIDRFLSDPEFGQHWANYWTDVIRFRVPPPELTFLSYEWFKPWLAEQFNKNTGWDAITREVLTATGNVKERPAATFIGYHQGKPSKLAAETARIFLSLQLQCAECHDSKFDHWKREQFHNLAAFFGRVSGKLGKAQDGSSTLVGDDGKGEWSMPDVKNPKNKGTMMEPVFLTGDKVKLGIPDLERRTSLAEYVTDRKNPWFAKAFVNRMWAQMTGRGFFEPVDNQADYISNMLPKTNDALADHFVATNFDTKGLLRVIANSESYQRAEPLGLLFTDKSTTIHNKLSGDEVFRSLELAIGLPNKKGQQAKPTAEIRFPPPPDSTRDVVSKKFQYDPSYCPEEVSRTMGQAMQLMNNEQIQAQINADPASGTLLSKLVSKEKDDGKLIRLLFRQALAREPNPREVTIAREYITKVGNRGEAFEDILWGLINSAEFTTQR